MRVEYGLQQAWLQILVHYILISPDNPNEEVLQMRETSQCGGCNICEPIFLGSFPLLKGLDLQLERDLY